MALPKTKLFVGARNSGKTTSLLMAVLSARRNDRPVFVLDSAVEHPDRSLIVKIRQSGIIHFAMVEFPDGGIGGKSILAENIRREKDSGCFLIDVSRFLEMGHRQNSPAAAAAMRVKYIQEARTSLECISDLLSEGLFPEALVILDEIEIPPEIASLVRSIAVRGGEIQAALHPPSASRSATSDFEIVVL